MKNCNRLSFLLLYSIQNRLDTTRSILIYVFPLHDMRAAASYLCLEDFVGFRQHRMLLCKQRKWIYFILNESYVMHLLSILRIFEVVQHL